MSIERRNAIQRERFADEVSGQIIGQPLIRGGLFYQGRMQGQCIWRSTDAELIHELTERKDAYVKEHHNIPGLFDDGPGWEIRIYED